MALSLMKSPNKGKVESSSPPSSSVESTYELEVCAKACVGRCQEERGCSFSQFRRWSDWKARGVPTGVGSAVDALSTSLLTGEWCKGGGVSRGSSFTESGGARVEGREDEGGYMRDIREKDALWE